MAISELNVGRDLFDIKFIMKSGVDPKLVEYYLEANTWNATHFELSINFTNPL